MTWPLTKNFRRVAAMSGLGLLALGACALAADPAVVSSDIVAGPMIGAVSDRTARVWMELATAKPVTVAPVEIEKGHRPPELTADVSGPIPFVCDMPISGLLPGKDYRIEVKLDDKPVTLPGPAVVIRTAPAAGTEANFSVAMGSNFPGPVGRGNAPIFKAISNLAPNPNAFFFLGNIGTLPDKLDAWPVAHRQAIRMIADVYSQVRREPDLQPLFRTTPCYAVWNDLDYGIPESAGDFVFRKESWAVFTRYWPNPDAGVPGENAVYFTSTIGDVDFFMLDGRAYRDAKARTMLGEVQLKWLQDNLLKSKATFKVIGCGSQLLADYGQLDAWSQFQPEQKNFIRWIFDNKISGVVFVSGGHFGEITAIKPPAGQVGYPLFEITTGPLAGKPLEKAPANPNRQNLAILDWNFATLDFGGQHEHRFMTMRLRDEKGKAQSESPALFATQLK